MKSRGQNEVAAQINSWRARCHNKLLNKDRQKTNANKSKNASTNYRTNNKEFIQRKHDSQHIIIVGGLFGGGRLFDDICGHRSLVSIRGRSPVFHGRVPHGKPTNERLPRRTFSLVVLHLRGYDHG